MIGNRNIAGSLRAVITTAIAGILATGCTATLAGGEYASERPARPAATYEVTTCLETSGQTVNLPAPVVYYLEEGAEHPTLYEFLGDSGTRFTNQWEAPDGRHFFLFIPVSGTGYELIIPERPGVPGVRRYYNPGAQASESPQGLRPTSVASGSCPMLPK